MKKDNKEPKKNTGLVIILVIDIIVIIALAWYICYDKQLIPIGKVKTETSINNQKQTDKKVEKDNSDVTTNDEDESIKDEEIQNTEVVPKLKSYAYATENDQYVLILNEYNRNWLNPKGGDTSNSFILSEDYYYTVNIAYGTYYIEGDKLVLYTLNNELTMLNKLGVNVIANQGQYSVSLPIINDTVVIGDTILYLK